VPESAIGATLVRAVPVVADQSLAGHRNKLFAGLSGGLLGFVIVMCGWQIALFAALFGGIVQFETYAGIHVIGCVILASWLVFRKNGSLDEERNSAALQIVAWSAFAGPFGALVATALAFNPTQPRARLSPDEDLIDHSAIERAERLHVALLERRLRFEGASTIRPLIDVIAEGSRSEKLEALRVVYRRHEAGLSTVLKRALQDSDTSVRVLAATVIAKLHATYSQNIGAWQAAATASPDIPQNWQTLAGARLAYAESELLESPRARAQIELAVGDLSRATELDPDGEASTALLGRARRKLAGWRS
jgi:hypothetical protein